MTVPAADPVSLLEVLGITPVGSSARGLCKYAEASSLVLAETGADGKEYLLTAEAAAAWWRLADAARTDGVGLFLASAFRSVSRQAEIIQEKLDAGQDVDDILAVVAPPGYSEHHTGCAVDIVSLECPALDEAFEFTAAYRWLVENAARFGFSLSYPRGNAAGYQYEPWHWCYRSGLPAARR